MTLSETLAEHVFRTDDLPAAAAEATRQRVLDTLAVAWAGADAPGGRAIKDAVAAEGGSPDAGLWAWGGRLPAAQAAFVNGVSAAALDYDSVYEAGSVHPDAVVVPAAWAVAEKAGASGAEFLAAACLGADVACRIGKAAHKNSGWFYTGVAGVFGAAAAAAKLMGLSASGIADALGLSLSQCAGTQQALIEKTVAKRLQSALAARAGVFCATLAAAGASAPREAIEGTYGYFKKYEDGDPDVLLAGLGATYENAKAAIKKFPSCTANHAAAETAIALARELDLDPEDVTSVEVTLSPFSHKLVGAPYVPGQNPQVAAQFSIQYSLASALLRRRLAIADIQADAATDPAAVEFAGRVRVAVDDKNGGKFAPASIAVTTKSRGRLERAAPFVPGTQDHPLSAADLEAKVMDCVTTGPRPLGYAEAKRLIQRVGAIDTVADMSRFFDDVLETRPARARA